MNNNTSSSNSFFNSAPIDNSSNPSLPSSDNDDFSSAKDLALDESFQKMIQDIYASTKDTVERIINTIERDLEQKPETEEISTYSTLLRELDGLMYAQEGTDIGIISAQLYTHFKAKITLEELDNIELFSVAVMPTEEMHLLKKYYPEAFDCSPAGNRY